MSQKSVELVRSLYVSNPERRASSSCSTTRSRLSPSPIRSPDHPELIRGKGAVTDFYRHYWGTWDDDYILEPAEITDAGANRVLVVHHERGRGRGSGVPFERRWVVIYTLVGGKLARIQAFSTRAGALEAAGLRE